MIAVEEVVVVEEEPEEPEADPLRSLASQVRCYCVVIVMDRPPEEDGPPRCILIRETQGRGWFLPSGKLSFPEGAFLCSRFHSRSVIGRP